MGRNRKFVSIGFLAWIVSMLLTRPLAAQTESVLYQFQGFPVDGSEPRGALVADRFGNLYGATPYGGSSAFCQGDPNEDGCGTVFELLPPRVRGEGWTETLIYSFAGGSSDGEEPNGNLVFDPAGNLYGTTAFGGTLGLGTVFRLTPPSTPDGFWTENILYSFGGTSDGRVPLAGLTIDGAGNLYGTTIYGGANRSRKCSSDGCGTVFELSPPGSGSDTWTETVLYNFGGDDGLDPYAPVAFDSRGDLLGTTLYSGSYNCTDCGTVFMLRPGALGGAWTESVLHRFTGGNDGSLPFAPVLIEGSSVYGTTTSGGQDNLGTVFQLAPSSGTWQETVLYGFAGGGDGAVPYGGLTFTANALFGTTSAGGASNLGTAFRLARPGGSWTEQILHSFTGPPDGASPAGVLIYISGSLYGLTGDGGQACNCGTFFQIAP